MVPQLMRFLLEQLSKALSTHLKQAAGISQQRRRQGFSLLTDKLVGSP
jgi:hypothetical protein